MSSLAIRQQAAQTERRRHGRVAIEIPVVLRTITGNRECRMANISDHGAMLETENPPAQGVSGWLIVGEDEFYCSVIWSKEGSCGIQFEHAIGEEALVEITGQPLPEAGPAANACNIKLGRKRGRLVVSDD